MISSSSHSSTSSGANVQTKIPFQGPVVNRSLSPQSTKYSYLSELGFVESIFLSVENLSIHSFYFLLVIK